MPDEEKKMSVPIDTSGPDATIDIEEVKDEVGCRNKRRKQETRNKNRKTFENEENKRRKEKR